MLMTRSWDADSVLRGLTPPVFLSRYVSLIDVLQHFRFALLPSDMSLLEGREYG